MYGVSAGYDFQLGGAVAGIEGEYTDSTTKRRGNELLIVGDSARLDTDRDLYIGARLGFAVGPTTMLMQRVDIPTRSSRPNITTERASFRPRALRSTVTVWVRVSNKSSTFSARAVS